MYLLLAGDTRLQKVLNIFTTCYWQVAAQFGLLQDREADSVQTFPQPTYSKLIQHFLAEWN
jgi:hypothetical protein